MDSRPGPEGRTLTQDLSPAAARGVRHAALLAPPGGRLRFGPFELDTATGELWKAGARIRLQLQPGRVLALLAGNPGRLITREEIQHEVWSDGTAVDFEQSLNFCVRQIRLALNDDASTPRFVETLPRRGYRFIGSVEPLAVSPLPAGGLARPVEAPAPPLALRPFPSRWAERQAWVSRRVAVAALAGLLAGAAVVAGLHQLRGAPRPPSYQRVTFGRGYVGSACFGLQSQVIYSAAWEGRPQAVYLLHPGRDARPLSWARPGLVAAPANGDVVFIDESNTLWRVPAAGGPAKAVLEGVLAADATRDGAQYAVARTVAGRTRIEFPVGQVLGEASFPSHVRISPGGDRVAFLEHPIRADDRGDVVVLDRAGRKRTLSAGWASSEGLAWSPDGDEVWFTAAALGADAALHAVSLGGRVRQVAPALGRLVLHDIARDGRVLLERNTLRQEMWYGRAGETEERDLSWLDLARVVEITRDGRGVLFLESGEGGGPGYSVYRRGVDEAIPVRIGQGRPFGLSPDGRWVLAVPVEPRDRLLLLPAGAGEARQLQDPGIEDYEWGGWLPDGGGILFTGRARGGQPRVYVRPLAGGARAVTPEGVTLFAPTVSPDGAGFVAPCPAGWCLYPLREGEPAPVAGAAADLEVLRWLDSTTLLVREPGRLTARLSRLDVATGRRTPWMEVGPSDLSGVRSVNAVAVTDDGAAWAYSFSRQISDLYVVEGLE